MPRILHVISDPDISAIVTLALHGAAFDVETTTTAAAALAAVQANCPDAVFVHEAAVPGSAAAFASQLRQIAGDTSLPICILGSRTEIEQEARAAGCEFLPNPLSLVALRAAA